MEPVKGKLALKLIELRGEQTLYRLAKEVGIARSLLFRYENGTLSPDTDKLEKLARHYSLDVYDLKKLYFADLYPEGSRDRQLLIQWALEVND